MCKDCGCEAANHHRHDHEHAHEHGHEHEHAHEHGHEHTHIAADGTVYTHVHASSPEPAREIKLEQAVLAANDADAAWIRGFLAARGVRAYNLISSPGSGKTLLLEKTLAELQLRQIPAAVIVGDQYGDADAARMRRTGVPVTQIEVGASCHLDAAAVKRELLNGAVPEGTKILFIENVGNLVCPVAFDLGENAKIALLSTPEGEEKPLKYPALFAAARRLLITKCDLAGVLGCDLELIKRNARSINPDIEIMELSSRSGAGVAEWVDSLLAASASAD